MELYIRTIQAVCHYNICRQELLNIDWDHDLTNYKEFIWKYWITGKYHFTTSQINCGDIITTDNNGNILTVNGQKYVHVK